MARTNRRYHSHANAEHHQNADPNNGSDDGRLGGTDQITEPDDGLAVGDAVEAKVLARHQPDRQLAERKRVGDEPHAILDAMGGTVAESLGRRDAPPQSSRAPCRRRLFLARPAPAHSTRITILPKCAPEAMCW